MFLAQILHESGGLKYIREINPPASAYDHNSKASTILPSVMNGNDGSEPFKIHLSLQQPLTTDMKLE